MTIVALTVLMIFVVAIGKRSRDMGPRQYMIIGLIAIVQVAIAAYDMWMKPFPPLH